MRRDLLTAVSLRCHQFYMEITQGFFIYPKILHLGWTWIKLYYLEPNECEWMSFKVTQLDVTLRQTLVTSLYVCPHTELMKHINHKLFLILSFFFFAIEREACTESGHCSSPPNFVLLMLHLCHFDFVNWLLLGLSLQEKDVLWTQEEIQNIHHAAFMLPFSQKTEFADPSEKAALGVSELLEPKFKWILQLLPDWQFSAVLSSWQ